MNCTRQRSHDPAQCQFPGVKQFYPACDRDVSEEDRSGYIVLLALITAPMALASTLGGLIAGFAGFLPVYCIASVIAVAGIIQTWAFFFSKDSPLPKEKRSGYEVSTLLYHLTFEVQAVHETLTKQVWILTNGDTYDDILNKVYQVVKCYMILRKILRR